MAFHAILSVIGLLVAAPASSSARADLTPPLRRQDICDDPGVDPWVRELRDSVLTGDALARFARDVYGGPPECRGSVTSEFDGNKFGEVILDFPGGASLEVRTQPPESSVTTLRADSGFPDESEIRDLLRRYAADIGLAIDWTAPTEERRGGDRIQRFADPDPGLNASVSLVFRDDRLVAVLLSLAL